MGIPHVQKTRYFVNSNNRNVNRQLFANKAQWLQWYRNPKVSDSAACRRNLTYAQVVKAGATINPAYSKKNCHTSSVPETRWGDMQCKKHWI